MQALQDTLSHLPAATTFLNLPPAKRHFYNPMSSLSSFHQLRGEVVKRDLES